MAEKEPYCDACNRRNQHCWCGIDLKGTPYDHETHGEVTEVVGSTDGSDEDEKDDDDDDESDIGDDDKSDIGDDNDKAIEPGHDEEGLLIRFNMGECTVTGITMLTHRPALPRLVSPVPQPLALGTRALSTREAALPRPVACQGRASLRLV